MHEITRFVPAFLLERNVGFIRIFLEDRSCVFRDLAIEKFTAFVSVLKNPNVYLDGNGWITTDPTETN